MMTDEYKEKMKKRREEEEKQQELIRQTACFTGHRPDKLGGYDINNPISTKLRHKLLEEVIPILIKKENISRFISGGALGMDMIAFYCVHILKKDFSHIKNILAIPFEKQDKVWSDEQKYWYRKMRKLADEVVLVDKIKQYSIDENIPVGEYHFKKMHKRNEYMVDNSRIIVSVFDGSKGGTSNCLYYANKMGKSIWRMNPKFDFELEIRYGW